MPRGQETQAFATTRWFTGLASGEFEAGVIEQAVVEQGGNQILRIQDGALSAEVPIRALPGFFSILPPLLAITLALVFRQVILSLFAGIWLAAAFVNDYDPIAGFFEVLRTKMQWGGR